MFKVSYHYITKKISVLFVVEILILLASAYLGAAIRFLDENNRFSPHFQDFSFSAFIFTFVMVVCMGTLGMYQPELRKGFRKTFTRLLPSFALGFCIVSLVFYWIPHLYVDTGKLALELVIASLGIVLVRILFLKSADSRHLASRIIFLGTGALAKECMDLVKSHSDYHKEDIIGCVPMTDQECNVPASSILHKDGSLLATVRKYNAREVVASVQDRRIGNFPIDELLECKLHGVKVTDATAFFEREACQIKVDYLNPSWLVFGDGFDQSLLRIFMKRAFDLVASAILFIAALPVMLITALFIFLEDRGSIFYQQERVGKNGETFMVLKFRSMRKNAEKAGVPQFAATNDSRVTRIGRIIRKLRIDELPQILNVLNGEMSFVGPRPERPYFVKQFCETLPYYNVRHSVKPGITGLAQVRYQYGASAEDALQKLEYDLYYVKNNNLFLDFLILLDTVQVVLFGKGSR
jgi:sugar transferase (PEP-CTERM system associated)